jgi:hypothetical protein
MNDRAIRIEIYAKALCLRLGINPNMPTQHGVPAWQHPPILHAAARHAQAEP